MFCPPVDSKEQLPPLMQGFNLKTLAGPGRMPIFTIVLTLFVLAGMGYVLSTGARIQAVNVPLTRAATSIEVEVVRAHLVMDEILAGDAKSRFEEVRSRLDHADLLARAMLDGADTEEWKIIPIDDPELTQQLGRTVTRLEEFRDAAKTRLYLATVNRRAGHDNKDNEQFEGAFTAFNLSMQRTNEALHHAMDNQFSAFVRTQLALIIACALLGLAAALTFFRFEWQRAGHTEALLEANLRARENDKQLVSTVLRSVGEGVIATDRKGVVTMINPLAEALTGRSHEAAMHQAIEDVLKIEGTRDRPTARHILYEVVVEEQPVTLKTMHILCSDGTRRPVELTASPLLDHEGEQAGMVLNFRDVTERKAFEDKLEQMALFDGLTGLFNRAQFDRRLEEEFQRAVTYYDLPLSLLLIDVDHFKNVNDSYGHQAGDAYLIELAKLVARHIRKVDLAARYGGEEIAIILPQTNGEQASMLAERLREQAEAMVVVCGKHKVSTTLSIGVASPQTTTMIAPRELLEGADQALYRAKNNGRNRVILFGSEAPLAAPLPARTIPDGASTPDGPEEKRGVPKAVVQSAPATDVGVETEPAPAADTTSPGKKDGKSPKQAGVISKATPKPRETTAKGKKTKKD